MEKSEILDDHGNFKELCAWAQFNSVSVREKLILDRHLAKCDLCRQIYDEYRAIGQEGMAYLSAEEELTEDARRWDDRAVRGNLFALIRKPQPFKVFSIKTGKSHRRWRLPTMIRRKEFAIASLAACALIALTLGSYKVWKLRSTVATGQAVGLPLGTRDSVPERLIPNGSSIAQSLEISNFEKQISSQQKEISQLRAASIAAEEQINELKTEKGQTASYLRQMTEERDQLANRLAGSEKAYEALQAEYSTLRADHNRSLLHTASVESELKDLRVNNQDQKNLLKDDEQYLSSDRDIRELMGARKLYIADVFDVDSVSHTRKPFGRVFYTESKSLVFYAFDLDRQPGVKNASVFQVWGQRDTEKNEASHAMNLGILYMDSETNRRWVLRADDPKQLAEIDAVFVTVEPHGGSQKPTGKPLLYALLRKEANHP
jgi:anti-sigma-K factor RskA